MPEWLQDAYHPHARLFAIGSESNKHYQTKGASVKSYFLWLAICLGTIPLFGQITGDLQVRVTDASEAVVANATVTVRSLDTGATRIVKTDDTGSVRISQLNIGAYEVKVEQPGFNAVTATANVASGDIATVPITLKVASATQQIEVQDVAAPVNTVNGQLQQVVDNQAISDLPLNSTGILGLAATAPGVIPVTPNDPFLGLGSYNSNGGRGRANNITLDNAISTDVSTTGGAGLGTVPLDAISEFNLLNNQFN